MTTDSLNMGHFYPLLTTQPQPCIYHCWSAWLQPEILLITADLRGNLGICTIGAIRGDLGRELEVAFGRWHAGATRLWVDAKY